IVAIGDLVLDVTIAPEGQLRLDADRDASIRIGGGGQAANFCAWAAALGAPTRLVTRIGDDESGRRLRAEIEAGGVEVAAVVGPDPTGTVAVLLGPSGERTFARQRGAGPGLRPAPLVGVVAGKAGADAVAAGFWAAYVDGDTPLEAAGRAVLVSDRGVAQAGARP